MATTRRRRLLAMLLAAGVLGMALSGLMAAPASAHDYETSYLYLDVGERELGGRAELTYTDLRRVFGLELEGTDAAILAELEANVALLHEYLAAHTAVGADGAEWPLRFDGVELLPVERTDDAGYALVPFEATVPGERVPQVLDVTFDPFVDEVEGRLTTVFLRNDLLRGVIDQESNALVVLDAGRRSARVDLGDTSQWKNFTASISLGVDHIRTGPDHILFIVALLLPAVLVYAITWRPAPSFGAGLWRVLKVASMFTVAHSITFTLAGLDLLPLPPSRLVETTIALSITAAALHNLWPILRQREWSIAFVFGLFHGMGFAAVVEALDVSRTTQLVSLFGRNVGIEIGQVVIIVVAFPALFLLSRTVYYRPLFVAGSLGLAAVSLVWAFERTFSLNAGITIHVVRAVRWPRSFFLSLVATALVAAVYFYERRSDRLLALEPEPVPAGGPPVTASR